MTINGNFVRLWISLGLFVENHTINDSKWNICKVMENIRVVYRKLD